MTTRAASATTVTSHCRLCSASCGIRVTLRDGAPVKVVGDPQHPLTHGYTCPAGRQLPAIHTHPDRLRHSLERTSTGAFERVDPEQAIDAIASTMRRLIDTHGPRSVAWAPGTGIGRVQTVMPFGLALWKAIGSPMMFTPATIDQPGKVLAAELHGRWGGHIHPLRNADVWMIVGANPLVSMWADGFMHDPARAFRDAKRRGTQLIVIDPRRTETAAFADLHIRPRSGEDATLLAGIARAIVTNGWHDRDFVNEHVKGIDELATALAPFDSGNVEQRTGVSPTVIDQAARMLSSSRRGGVHAGTGPNMGPRGPLAEYLMLVIQSLCGHWPRAGDVVANPGVLVPPSTWIAEAVPVSPPASPEPSRIRGLSETTLGMPTATAADEMLLDGEGRVRALICVGSNPLMSWPDRDKTRRGLAALELLVTIDPVMSATSHMAHYVLAPKLSFETEGMTRSTETLTSYGATTVGFDRPFGMFSPIVCEPPPGSELIEEWELFYGLAQRLGLELTINGRSIDMVTKPSSRALFELLTDGSRVPLSEVMRHEHGAFFPDDAAVIAQSTTDPLSRSRLDVGHPRMTHELAELAGEDIDGAFAHYDPERHPFRLLCRRTLAFKNSSGQHLESLTRGTRHNPAYMNPDDLLALGLESGDRVEITSTYASVLAFVEAAPDVMPGTVSISHGFGGVIGLDDDDDPTFGTNVSRLLTNEHGFDRYSGQPLMTAIPVSVRRSAKKAPP